MTNYWQETATPPPLPATFSGAQLLGQLLGLGSMLGGGNGISGASNLSLKAVTLLCCEK